LWLIFFFFNTERTKILELLKQDGIGGISTRQIQAEKGQTIIVVTSKQQLSHTWKNNYCKHFSPKYFLTTELSLSTPNNILKISYYHVVRGQACRIMSYKGTGRLLILLIRNR
jgi:hypothetical protein